MTLHNHFPHLVTLISGRWRSKMRGTHWMSLNVAQRILFWWPHVFFCLGCSYVFGAGTWCVVMLLEVCTIKLESVYPWLCFSNVFACVLFLWEKTCSTMVFVMQQESHCFGWAKSTVPSAGCSLGTSGFNWQLGHIMPGEIERIRFMGNLDLWNMSKVSQDLPGTLC